MLESNSQEEIDFYEEIDKITSKFDLIDSAKENISSFLKNGNKPDPIIEHYLKEYSLIIFYAEMEEKLKSLLELYCQSIGKENLSVFLSHSDTLKKIMNAVNKDDLRKTFKALTDEENGDEYLDNYKTLVNNRHAIAHKNPGEISWYEIENMDMSLVARKVITALQKHLDE